MRLRHLISFLSIWIGLAGSSSAADLQVADRGQAKHSQTGIIVVSGSLELPSEGRWVAPNPFNLKGSITQIFLQPPQDWVGVPQSLNIAPLNKKPALEKPLASRLVYEIYGLKQPGRNEPSRFELQNTRTGESVYCVWQPSGKFAVAGIIQAWAKLRAQFWLNLAQSYDAPVLKQWIMIQQRLYGTGKEPSPVRRSVRNPDRRISGFGVLGGQAALQETFQLQELQMNPSAGEIQSIPVSQIEGVQVKSHPFKEMLGDQTGGRMPLADAVPMDHLLVHFPQPQAVQPFLEQGSDFMSHLGSIALGRSLHYDLADRYLDRLGLTREVLESLLQSGIVQELVLFMPDLFLIDGTEMGVVARAPQFRQLMPLLKLIGLKELTQGRIIEISTASGTRAFWSLDGDFIFVSTHRSLLERSLKLHRSRGLGSLGQSDEFRYMLTQLRPTERTRSYIYFSDAFIRRLVSPGTKIAQLRRLHAGVNMNLATSAALLYQLDRHSAAPTVERLVKLGYLPKDFDQDDVVLDSDFIAVSRSYGTNSQRLSLVEKPVAVATASEAKAYQQYVDSYRRYWRQYFDPIAVRLDDTQDGGLELTTFILPLLESSMYRQIREWVPGQPGPQLHLPQLEPAPIATLSLNLTDKVWGDLVGQFMRRMVAEDTGFVDDFGPSLHIAIQDGDPVLAFGGGDLLGIMGQVGGVNDMMMITTLVSLLTRPCAILIETQNPESLRQMLEQNGPADMFPRLFGSMQTETYRITGRDAWVLCVDLFDLARLRFGVEVQGNYLIITNQPWSQRLTVRDTVASPLGDASLHLEPAALQKQLAAMFTSASEKARQIALQGNAMLAPLIWTGSGNISEAVARHRELFGFVPEHPNSGAWNLDTHGNVTSTDYGSVERPQQPGYEEGQRGFGLLEGINPVNVSLQIEDTGLRTRIYWNFDASKE